MAVAIAVVAVVVRSDCCWWCGWSMSVLLVVMNRKNRCQMAMASVAIWKTE